MFHESFRTLFWREFTSIKQGAEYFHVSKPTITRWLDGTRKNFYSSKRLVICLMTFVGLDFVLMRNARC